MDYRFLTTKTNLKALYIYISLFFNTTSSVVWNDCADFCLQIFVYHCIFQKKEKETDKNLLILKMKTPFEKEPHFENESSFWKRFWR